MSTADDPQASWQPSPNCDSGGNAMNLIILHTTEGGFDGSLGWLCNPQAQASAQYIVSADGSRIAQLVREADVAWGCGNLGYNQRAIQIEQEGYEAKGGFSDGLYATVGALVGRIARRHSIPLDRAHVIGHMDVPDPYHAGQFGGSDHHSDPGPLYDFDRVLAIAKGGTVIARPAAVDQPRWFPETQHYVSHGFKAFYESHDDALQLFGYPLSEEFTNGDGLTVQWFERARFEWHPGSKQNPWDVLLGRLGAATLNADKGANPTAFAPAEAPK